MLLTILSGGAANGLVDALAPAFRAATGADVAGTFGAVGLMRDRLVAGEPADLVILTRALIADLVATGHVVPGTARDLGLVRTAIAVRRGDPLPLVGDADLLKAAWLAADEVHVPDTRQSTAGIHIAKMLAALGITEQMAPRLREHPNGMTAMAGLAASRAARPIGCTQVTEIRAAPGITLVRTLPGAFDLATAYTAGVAAKARQPDLAARLLAMLTSDAATAARLTAGFEVI